MGLILFQEHITQQDVMNNPWITYVFGDNDLRLGRGGQAKATRGLPNVIGIRVKKLPAMTPQAYYTDDEYSENIRKIGKDIEDVEVKLNGGNVVVIPSKGIGTGLAQLKLKAPKTAIYLNNRLQQLFMNHRQLLMSKRITVRSTEINASTKGFSSYDRSTFEDTSCRLKSFLESTFIDCDIPNDVCRQLVEAIVERSSKKSGTTRIQAFGSSDILGSKMSPRTGGIVDLSS